MTVWSLAGATPVDRRDDPACAELPAPLFEFYSQWEPASAYQTIWICDDLDEVDPEMAAEFNVWIHPLDEVRMGRLADHCGFLNLGDWGACEAVFFGATCFAGDHIVYIERPPGNHPGRIFVVGDGVPTGRDFHVYCLAGSFQEWMCRVMQFRGVDLILIPGNIPEMVSPVMAQRLKARMFELNPELNDPPSKSGE